MDLTPLWIFARSLHLTSILWGMPTSFLQGFLILLLALMYLEEQGMTNKESLPPFIKNLKRTIPVNGLNLKKVALKDWKLKSSSMQRRLSRGWAKPMRSIGRNSLEFTGMCVFQKTITFIILKDPYDEDILLNKTRNG